jgi:predicted PurR-regulated permease PerM
MILELSSVLQIIIAFVTISGFAHFPVYKTKNEFSEQIKKFNKNMTDKISSDLEDIIKKGEKNKVKEILNKWKECDNVLNDAKSYLIYPVWSTIATLIACLLVFLSLIIVNPTIANNLIFTGVLSFIYAITLPILFLLGKEKYSKKINKILNEMGISENNAF